MPRPIPMEEVLDTAVVYILKRQVSGRPTTLRQLSKRVGLGVATTRGELDAGGVEYVLIAHDEETWAMSAMEIVIRSIPESLSAAVGFTLKEVENSFREIFGDSEPVPVDPTVVEEEVSATVSDSDPYYIYRITAAEYRKMKKDLISYPELKERAKKEGYSGSALLRAVGGNRLTEKFAHPRWRPYIYQGSRFYKREVLKHLSDLQLTYKDREVSKTKEKKRKMRASSLASLMEERF